GPLGQILIKQFGKTSSNLTLGQWLAANFPRLYGGANGSANVSGFTNAQVATFFVTLFNLPEPTKVSAEVLATALNIFATTTSLGGTLAQGFGFTVNALGLGAFATNIGFTGAVFGVPNHTILTGYQVMMAANKFAVAGRPWGTQAYQIIQAVSIFKVFNSEAFP